MGEQHCCNLITQRPGRGAGRGVQGRSKVVGVGGPPTSPHLTSPHISSIPTPRPAPPRPPPPTKREEAEWMGWEEKGGRGAGGAPGGARVTREVSTVKKHFFFSSSLTFFLCRARLSPRATRALQGAAHMPICSSPALQGACGVISRCDLRVVWRPGGGRVAVAGTCMQNARRDGRAGAGAQTRKGGPPRPFSWGCRGRPAFPRTPARSVDNPRSP